MPAASAVHGCYPAVVMLQRVMRSMRSGRGREMFIPLIADAWWILLPSEEDVAGNRNNICSSTSSNLLFFVVVFFLLHHIIWPLVRDIGIDTQLH